MWTFDVNDVGQNSSYIQLLVHQMSTELFMKPAVVRDFVWCEHVIVPNTKTG